MLGLSSLMRRGVFLGCFVWGLLLAGEAAADVTDRDFDMMPIIPLKKPSSLNPVKVKLGEHLFFNRRLSKDNSISCAHCHHLDEGGADITPHSFGINGSEGAVNTPTVYNADYNLAQFWDGRAALLEDQIDGPTHNPIEMGSNWKEIIGKLSDDDKVVREFKAVYGENEITSFRIKDAIATFERSLVTVNSPFDRFLQGDSSAISSEAKKGYHLFQSLGCISCHQGANVGGNLYQLMGVFENYFEGREDLSKADNGRFNVTGDEEDRHKFKVPSLRMVIYTAPYFHDGSAKTLPDAIRVMGIYQLGQHLSDEQVHAIAAFLNALAGERYRGVHQ